MKKNKNLYLIALLIIKLITKLITKFVDLSIIL